MAGSYLTIYKISSSLTLPGNNGLKCLFNLVTSLSLDMITMAVIQKRKFPLAEYLPMIGLLVAEKEGVEGHEV